MASIITGTGVAIPEATISNDDLALLMDTDDAWIASRSGVRQRQLSQPGHGSSELAAKAGASAMEDAGMHVSQIDALVTATMTPDYYAPGIAGLVQERLGLGAIPAFDLRQQCSGFLYGLDLADCLITAGRAEHVLVIGAEVHSGFMPWGERNADGSFPFPDEAQRQLNNDTRGWSVLFGDGSGAMVVQKAEGEDGIIASRLFTDGSQFEIDLRTRSGLASSALRRPGPDRREAPPPGDGWCRSLPLRCQADARGGSPCLRKGGSRT